jgi:hypothetical protein
MPATCRRTRAPGVARATRRVVQRGGDRAQDFAIINEVYSHIRNTGELIASIYNVKRIYNSCPGYAPKSRLGGKKGDALVVPSHLNLPRGPTERALKPMNMMLRHAYNFFFKYAELKTTNTNVDLPEIIRANGICQKLQDAFLVFNRAAGEYATIPAKKAAKKQFDSIQGALNAMAAPPANHRAAGPGARESEGMRRAEAAAEALARAADVAKKAAANLHKAAVEVPFPNAW